MLSQVSQPGLYFEYSVALCFPHPQKVDKNTPIGPASLLPPPYGKVYSEEVSKYKLSPIHSHSASTCFLVSRSSSQSRKSQSAKFLILARRAFFACGYVSFSQYSPGMPDLRICTRDHHIHEPLLFLRIRAVDLLARHSQSTGRRWRAWAAPGWSYYHEVTHSPARPPRSALGNYE